LQPFLAAAGLEYLGNECIGFVDMPGTAAHAAESGVALEIAATCQCKKIAPVLIVVDHCADIAIAGLIRAALMRENASIACRPGRRLIGKPGQMIAANVFGNGFEHWHFDGLATATALPVVECCTDCIGHAHADGAIHHVDRYVARHTRSGSL